MHLDQYLDDVARQLAVAASSGGPEARELAERLTLPLHSAMRLALLDALSAAAEELTVELAPGSVEMRLRGREPSFVVAGVSPSQPAGVRDAASEPSLPQDDPSAGATAGAEAEDGLSTRINLRMPESLKLRVEAAAAHEGRSVNAWLVRAATDALRASEHPAAAARRGQRSQQRYTGWAQ